MGPPRRGEREKHWDVRQRACRGVFGMNTIRVMAWIWLFAAGLCEVGWAAGLKRYGFTFRTVGGVGTLAGMLLSFVLLQQAMKSLPLGTSYAVWTGIGAAGAVVFGIVVLGESSDWRRLACVGLILAGIVGLKLLSGGEGAGEAVKVEGGR